MAGFRTSKLASETSKIVDALARRTSARQASTANGSTHTTPQSKRKHSSAQASLLEPVADATSIASPSRKRKRGAEESGSLQLDRIKLEGGVEEPASPVLVRVKEETVSARSSPRKTPATPNGAPKRARRQPAKRIRGTDGEVTIEPPPNWEEVYTITKNMRSQVLAPVDTMGCESLAEDTRAPRERRFQTLVALMLSSQTKDTVTAVAMKNLQDNLPGGFTLESILKVDPPVLNELIGKVGFHNNKTKFVKATAEILRDQHESDIPDTIEGMIALPGVGPKMAYLCMSAAWGRDEGIGVDVHVHRITNLWGWHKTNNPEETRAMLEAWLPKDKWHDINHLLVGFGQTWCPPVGRKCDECHLAAKGLCPSAVVGKKVVKREKKEEVLLKEEGGKEQVIKQESKVELDLKPLLAKDLGTESATAAGSTVTPDIEDFGATRRSTRLAA